MHVLLAVKFCFVLDNIGRFCLSNPDVSFTIIGSFPFFKEAMITTWMQLSFYFNQKVKSSSTSCSPPQVLQA